MPYRPRTHHRSRIRCAVFIAWRRLKSSRLKHVNPLFAPFSALEQSGHRARGGGRPDERFLLLYTSSRPTIPRACRILSASSSSTRRLLPPWKSRARSSVPPPLTHLYGLSFTHERLLGAQSYCRRSLPRLAGLSKSTINCVFAVPAHFNRCSTRPSRQHDFSSSLRLPLGSPVPRSWRGGEAAEGKAVRSSSGPDRVQAVSFYCGRAMPPTCVHGTAVQQRRARARVVMSGCMLGLSCSRTTSEPAATREAFTADGWFETATPRNFPAPVICASPAR